MQMRPGTPPLKKIAARQSAEYDILGGVASESDAKEGLNDETASAAQTCENNDP